MAGGNSLGGAAEFSEAMRGCDRDRDRDKGSERAGPAHPGHLRYLGLSHTHLTGRAVGAILERLASSCSLTYIDLSANAIEDMESIRTFFINNAGLRAMDLSNNKINMHCLSEINLGRHPSLPPYVMQCVK